MEILGGWVIDVLNELSKNNAAHTELQNISVIMMMLGNNLQLFFGIH